MAHAVDEPDCMAVYLHEHHHAVTAACSGEVAAHLRGAVGLGGGAGGGGSSMTLGKVGQGELAPGDAREIPFVSDTSGSIIIILNSEDKGPLNFQLRTPGMDIDDESINGDNAAERGFVYESYNDGEGTNVIYFKTDSGEHGTYLGKLDNPAGNPDIKYTIEFHLESSVQLSSELDDADDQPQTVELHRLRAIVADHAPLRWGNKLLVSERMQGLAP